jgi:hypothetical protein
MAFSETEFLENGIIGKFISRTLISMAAKRQCNLRHVRSCPAPATFAGQGTVNLSARAIGAGWSI